MESTPVSEISEEIQQPQLTFRNIVDSAKLIAALDALGFSTPTPVQGEALPLAFVGKDLVVQAKTGSGKTFVYALPLLRVLEQEPEEHGTLALVLTPTRELANQICEVVHSLANDVQPVCVIGGISIDKQLKDLDSDARVVVGTPGRILDLIRKRELDLRRCKFFAVDEVDEMFSMDFVEDVRSILSNLPKARQGIFVSATVSSRVESLAQNFLDDPSKIAVESADELMPLIDHRYCMLPGDVTAKVTALCDLIETTNPRSAIIFCNTKSDTELVEVYLRRRGYDARLINSDLNQRQRDAIVGLIRAEKLRFLIGTDIAARGLDIDHIDLVVNYSLPSEHESYVHRTGRTGRAGRSGTAISLIGPHDFGSFMNLKRHVKVEFTEQSLPTETEVLDARLAHLLSVIKGIPGDAQPKEISLAGKVLKEIGGLDSPTPELTQLMAKLGRVLLEHQALTAARAAAAANPAGAENATPEVDLTRPRRDSQSDSRSGGRSGGGGRGGFDRSGSGRSSGGRGGQRR